MVYYQFNNLKVPLNLSLSSTPPPQSLPIHYGIHQTPFGKACLALLNDHIVFLAFISSNTQALDLLKQKFKNNPLKNNPNITLPHIHNLFTQPQHPINIHIFGTPFQTKVWKSLLNIPFSKTAHYQAIAQKINTPLASRAIGSAVGANPIAFIIPCHRILRKNGHIGGYRWGLDIKNKILQYEQQNT